MVSNILYLQGSGVLLLVALTGCVVEGARYNHCHLNPVASYSNVIRFEDDALSMYFKQECGDIINFITKSETEKALFRVFKNITRHVCTRSNLVLDIGANCGFYGLFAAAMGCRSILFEPQPDCIDYIKRNICLNPSVYSAVRLVPHPVSDVQTAFDVPTGTKCQGALPVNDKVKHASQYGVVRSSTVNALDVAKGQSVYIAKIDTEGHEHNILKTLRPLADKGLIQNIFMEVTPTFYARDGVSREAVYDEVHYFLTKACNIFRVMQLDNPGGSLSTPEALRKFVVEEDFLQEDIWIQC